MKPKPNYLLVMTLALIISPFVGVYNALLELITAPASWIKHVHTKLTEL